MGAGVGRTEKVVQSGNRDGGVLLPCLSFHSRFQSHIRVMTAVAAVLAVTGAISAQADPIKIGVIKASGAATAFIAQDKGFFAAEGVPAELVYFDASQPVAVATASGAIDFGVTGFTAGFYSLAGQGELRLIGGGYAREAPGFHNQAYVVSNQAYAAGLTTLKNFPGHSVAISQTGSPPHYALGLLIEKYHMDASTIRVLPLQAIANMASAVSGGQADTAIMTATASLAVVQKGNGKLLGWVGDETPWEFGATFTSTKTANDHHDTVVRFLKAWREGAQACHDAFADANDKPVQGATAPEMIAILAKYTGLDTDTLQKALPYCDPQARLDVKDVAHQIAYYKAQGMLKPDIDGNTIIDQRYVVPMPAK
jgi:NitT/TauT family transport system substrate-binding protein